MLLREDTKFALKILKSGFDSLLLRSLASSLCPVVRSTGDLEACNVVFSRNYGGFIISHCVLLLKLGEAGTRDDE